MPNEDWNPETTLREFRVKKVIRYIVTDWSDYRGGGTVREIAECANAALANEIAETFGKRYPGSLVNPMEQDPYPASWSPPTTIITRRMRSVGADEICLYDRDSNAESSEEAAERVFLAMLTADRPA